jgi:gliding motility-associated-like protein
MLPSLLMGQVLSNKGRFSVQFDKGCNPMTVNITEHDSFGDISRDYYYEENSNITGQKTHTYTSAGVYDIIQVNNVNNQGSKFDTLRIEVFDSQKPIINIEKCSGNEISVKSMDSRHDFIRLYFGGADSVQLNFSESIVHTFASSSIQSIGLKGFYLNATENCSEYFEEIVPIPALPTPSISMVGIKESCKDLFTLYLELDSFDSLITYQVELTQATSSVVLEGKINSEKLILSDIPFDISQSNYCVQVNSLDPCNASKVEGIQICKESSNLSLSPFESMYSSYESNGIFINLDDVESGTFIVHRRIEGGEFQQEDSITSTYTDTKASRTRRYFYKLDYIDSCNQVLYSAETSPPFIEAKRLYKNSYSISYSPPTNALNSSFITEYIVGNENESTTNSINSTDFTIHLDSKDGTSSQFLISQVVYSDGKIAKSNSKTLKFDVIIYVPTAFTPNNDGLNDTLELFGLPTNIATTNIYTKWGHLVYSSDIHTPGWDGTINGQLAPEGTYLYEIIFESTDGEKIQQKGTFALITK